MSETDPESLIRDFLQDAGDLAHRAILQDNEGHPEIAIYFYRESISLLDRARVALTSLLTSPPSELEDSTSSNEDQVRGQGWFTFWKDKLTMANSKMGEYQRRIQELETIIVDKQLRELDLAKSKTEEQLTFDRAKFLVSSALDVEEDPVGRDEEAVKLYTEAVHLCLQAKASPKIDAVMASQIATLASQALSRAEKLKGIPSPKRSSDSDPSLDPGPVPDFTPWSTTLVTSVTSAHASDIPTRNPGRAYYTDAEKRVLLTTSRINGIDYLPWMEVDLTEKFGSHLPYDDLNGLLALSPKQRRNFSRWERPEGIWSSPKMITESVNAFSIKQTVISDCSFVASLSVSALYEKRFGKRLITSIIYPRNKAGDPVYNPCGKYLVKLLLNGVPRKVVVDDRLPLGRNGELLCSYSNNKGELWVSLLEKAYMKVMGGYDFPGSNSNIDLHALTGWIPERVSINSPETPFEKDKTFYKLQDRMGKGDVLVTVATGNLGEREADRAGLVPTHAYAVLDIREVKGVRLLLVKNPWSHLRWKGNYSELDAVHWTPEMKRLLNYDPSSASMFDNGVFWIDYDSICKFFDVIYMNWNPALFPFTYCTHSTWSAGVGPSKDVYNISENPQYHLEVKSPPDGGAAVWILLTRHITHIQDFKENTEYITVLVYDTDGRRVFYPYEPPPMIDGVRINSPHYLCKIRVRGASTLKKFTLVISQYAKLNNIHYTLRAYSSCPFSLGEIPEATKYSKQVTGEWKGRSAGGCANHPESHQNNPCYKVALKTTGNDNSLIIELKGPKDFHVGFDIICSNVGDPKAPGFFNKKSSGNYRPGFVVLQLDRVPSGVYHIIPSTFKPGCESPFFLKVKSSCDFSMEKL